MTCSDICSKELLRLLHCKYKIRFYSSYDIGFKTNKQTNVLLVSVSILVIKLPTILHPDENSNRRLIKAVVVKQVGNRVVKNCSIQFLIIKEYNSENGFEKRK